MSFEKIIKKDNFIIRKNSLNFYEIENKPSENELNKFYTDLLYQNPEEHTSSYNVSYSEEEFEYIENKSKKIYEIIQNNNNKTLLDIGCGEGFVSKLLFDKGYNIKSLDYSDYGIQKFNSSILKYFEKGDVFKNLDKIIDKGEQYGIIILNNVIEHVLDPILVLNKIKNILSIDGILIITAPNDFSNLQYYLIENKIINTMNWISPPAHLSYFTLESLSNTIKHCGYKVYDYYAEYPIDFDLLVDHTNYVNNPVGKFSHLKRLRVDNFLCKQSISKTIKYYKSLADLGTGRDIVLFVKK